MDRGMEKMAPPPVPTHRRPEMMVTDEIWRGESDKKGWPTKEKMKKKLIGSQNKSGLNFRTNRAGHDFYSSSFVVI